MANGLAWSRHSSALQSRDGSTFWNVEPGNGSTFKNVEPSTADTFSIR